jgi:hypothetical protein
MSSLTLSTSKSSNPFLQLDDNVLPAILAQLPYDSWLTCQHVSLVFQEAFKKIPSTNYITFRIAQAKVEIIRETPRSFPRLLGLAFRNQIFRPFDNPRNECCDVMIHLQMQYPNQNANALLSSNNVQNDKTRELILIDDLLDCTCEDVDALARAIDSASYSCRSFHLLALLAHPMSAKLPLTGLHSLGSAICWAARWNDTKSLAILLDHSLTARIPPTGDKSLGEAVCSAAERGNYKCLKLLFAHPSAEQIPSNGDFSIGAAVCSAAINGCPDCLKILFDHPSAAGISPTGPYSLRTAVSWAQMWNRHNFLNLLLAHPSATQIPGLCPLRFIRKFFLNRII